jgi:hypothetical protein
MTHRLDIRRISLAAALAAASIAACGDADSDLPSITGVSSGTEVPGATTQTARVRVVNLFPGAPSAGLFAGNSAVGPGLSFGAANGSCVDVPVGRALSFRATGQTASLATIATPALAAGQQYTVVLFGSGQNAQAVVLNDNDLVVPAAGSNALRFFNATGTAADVWVTAPNGALTGAPGASGLAAGQATTGAGAFTSFPTTATQVRLFDVGSTTGTPRATTTVDASSLSANRLGTVFVTTSTLAGGGNASLVVAPCP